MFVGFISQCLWPLGCVSHSSYESGVNTLWITCIYWSVKHVQVSRYLIAGLIMLLFVIAMSCLLMLVDIILRGKVLVLLRTWLYGAV